MAENKRLSDLTRLLLSSSAFSVFLNEISGTTSPSEAIDSILSSSGPPLPSPSSMPPKDVNPHTHRQSTAHIGMSMIPEESSIEVDDDTHYNSGRSNFGIYGTHAQVYALPTLPAAPSLDSVDFTLLNDKTAADDLECSVSTSLKFAPAPLERMPEPAPIQLSQNAFDEEDTENDEDLLDLTPVGPNTISAADDLYAEMPNIPAAPQVKAPSESVVASKPSSFDLVITRTHREAVRDTTNQFERDCRILDVLAQRVLNGIVRRE